MNQTLHTSTHPWTRAQDETLRRLIKERAPVHDIAQRLHRPDGAAINRASELGLTTRH